MTFNVNELFGEETDAVIDKWFYFKSGNHDAQIHLILRYEVNKPKQIPGSPGTPANLRESVELDPSVASPQILMSDTGDPRQVLVLQGEVRRRPGRDNPMSEAYKRYLRLRKDSLCSYKTRTREVPTRMIPVYDMISVEAIDYNPPTETLTPTLTRILTVTVTLTLISKAIDYDGDGAENLYAFQLRYGEEHTSTSLGSGMQEVGRYSTPQP